MGHVEGFNGHPWDNPYLREADEMRKAERERERERSITPNNAVPKHQDQKESHKISDKELCEHYAGALSKVESYLVCCINNLWSIMKKKPRSEHQGILNEIYALEDVLLYLQKEQVI